MATTLQNVLKGIRNANVIDRGKVNAGITDDVGTPFVSVLDFHQEPTYDTGGVTLLESSFKVLVVAKDADTAETLAEAVDVAINLNTDLTPTAIGVFREAWHSSQVEEKLFKWCVELAYSMTEDPGKNPGG